MKKTKKNILLFVSAIFFLPSLSLNNPTATEILTPYINHPINTFSSSWKSPHPTISGKVSFQTLSAEEEAAYYRLKVSISPIPTDETLEELFNRYGDMYAVSSDVLRSIAYCESHFDPNATNGIYGGMYQYSTSTWISTRNSMGENNDSTLRFNAGESIKTSAFKIAAGGIGAWPNCN